MTESLQELFYKAKPSGLGGYARIIERYGTSLEETRKMVGELGAALKARKYKFLPSPVFMTPGEAAEYGITLEEPLPEDWMLKITPIEGGTPTISFITPDKWEIRGEDEYVSPEGEVYTRAQMEAMERGLTLEKGAVAPPARQFRIAVEQGLIPEGSRFLGIEGGQIQYIPPGEAKAETTTLSPEDLAKTYGEQELYRWTIATQYEAHEALREIFPEETIEEILVYADEDPEGFIGELLEAGRTEETETILKFFGATDAEIGEIFGETPAMGEMPEIPEEGLTLTLTNPAGEYTPEVAGQAQEITIMPDKSVWVEGKKVGTYNEEGQLIPIEPMWQKILRYINIPAEYLAGRPLYYTGVYAREAVRAEPGEKIEFLTEEQWAAYDKLPWWQRLLYEIPFWVVLGMMTPSAGGLRAKFAGRPGVVPRAISTALRPMAGLEAAQARVITRAISPVMSRLNQAAIRQGLRRAATQSGITLSKEAETALLNAYYKELPNALGRAFAQEATRRGVTIPPEVIESVSGYIIKSASPQWASGMMMSEFWRLAYSPGATLAITEATQTAARTTALVAVSNVPTVLDQFMATGTLPGVVEPSTTGIPTMITSAMRTNLGNLGWTAQAIAKMTPAQAWSIIQGELRATEVGIAPAIKPPAIDAERWASLTVPEKVDLVKSVGLPDKVGSKVWGDLTQEEIATLTEVGIPKVTIKPAIEAVEPEAIEYPRYVLNPRNNLDIEQGKEWYRSHPEAPQASTGVIRPKELPTIPKVEAPKVIVPAKAPVIEQVRELYSEIDTQIKAAQMTVKGLRGDEAKIARETLRGLERELAYTNRTLEGFTKRPELPDATKLRQTIMAWARYKGIPKTQLTKITSSISGRRHLSVVPQEQLVKILDKVREFRPVRIGGKTVVTPKTETKLHSLKDTLVKEGLLSEEAYQNLKSRLNLLTDRYVRHDLFITERDAKALIRAMNDEAEVGYAAIQAGDAKVLEAHPDIARRIKDIEARIEKQGQVYFQGKPATASIFKDMRFYTEDLEIRTGKPFKHIWDLANNRHLENRIFFVDLLKELRTATPAFTKIVNDKDALQRISDYIAAKNNWLKVKSPADIRPEEITLANKIEQLLMDRIPDYRYQRFLHFYHQSEGNVDIIIKEIPDAPRKSVQIAINIYESKGPIALKSYLDKQTWGVIESGFEPHYVVNPKLAMKRMRRVAFPTGRFQARTTVEFDRMDKDIISRTKTYLRQIIGMNLKPYVRQIERIYADAIPQLKNPRQVNKALSSSLNEMMGYIEEGGLMYRFLVRFASQAYTAIFGTYPHLPFRNLFQNLAFHPDRSCLVDPRNRPLAPQDHLYYETYITQMEAIPRDLMLAYEGGLPGLGRINRFSRRLNLYGKSDSKANRPWCNWGSFNKAHRALTQYLKDDNLDKFINNSGMNDLTLMQQRDILLLLKREVVSYKAPQLRAVDGGRAAIREIAREITNNVHFLYDRSQRAPIEMAGMGRIFGSLLVFPRSFGQRMLLQLLRLKPGSGATGAMRRRAMKIIIGNILAGIAVGEIYQRITGKKRNPYNPLNVLGWTPGGLAVGVAVDLGKAIGDMLMALGGDKDALSRLPGEIARLGDAMIPFYYAIMNALEALTDKEYIDRLALRKIRELFDKSYTVNESFYDKERDIWAAIIHAMFGGEVEGMEIPPNPEIARIKREHNELFELYDAYGNEDSTRYIEDDDERREAREKLLQDNPEFADDRRRLIMYQLGIGDEKVMEAYREMEWWRRLIADIPFIGDMWANPSKALRLDKELIEDYVARGRLVDKYGATSAEVHLFDYEHPELRVFGESEDTFDWSEFNPSDQDIKRWRLMVENRELIDLMDSYNDKHSDNYIKDDEERLKAYERLYQEHPGFLDDLRRIEAYSKDALTDKIVSDYIEYMHIVDQYGATSAEAKLFKLDHPAMFEWGQLEDVKDWEDGSDWNRTLLEINARWREMDVQYDALETDDAREAFLEKHPDYHKDRLRRDAYHKGYSEKNIEFYVQYSMLPTYGDWRERFLLDPAHSSFYDEWISAEVGEGHPLIDPSKVSPLERDEIYFEFEEQFRAWDDTAGLTDKQIERMRDKLLQVEGFAEARYRVQAYDYGLPEKHHGDYVEWYISDELKKPDDWAYDDWWEDDRFLMEHPEFEDAMVQLYKNTDGAHGWKEKRDFSGIPGKKIEGLYQQYQDIKGDDASYERLLFRYEHRDLDEWMFDTDRVSETMVEKDWKPKPILTGEQQRLIDVYEGLPAGSPRLHLRCEDEWLDNYLVETRGYTPCYGTYRCGVGEREEFDEWVEYAEREAGWQELLRRMRDLGLID